MDTWFVQEESGLVVVDPDKAYPQYLAYLGVKPEEATQHALEAARKCFTEDLAQTVGLPLHVRIPAADRKWALKNFPPGTRLGSSFQAIYRRMRGTPMQRIGVKLQ